MRDDVTVDPHEAPQRAQGATGFFHGRAEDGLEIEIGAQAAPDRREEAVALERLGERDRSTACARARSSPPTQASA